MGGAGGEGEGAGGAFFGGAFYFDLAAVFLAGEAGEVESEAGALVFCDGVGLAFFLVGAGFGGEEAVEDF